MTKTITRIWMLIALLLCSVSMNAQTGTMERWGAKMKYTLSGGVVTKKEKPYIGSLLNRDMLVAIEGEVKEGATFSASCTKVAGPKNKPKHYWMDGEKEELEMEFYCKDSQGKDMKLLNVREKNADGTKSVSFTVPQGAKMISVDMKYNTQRTIFHVETEWKVVKETSEPRAVAEGGAKAASGKVQKKDKSDKRSTSYLSYTVRGGKVTEHRAEYNSMVHFVDLDVTEGTTVSAAFNGHNGGDYDTQKYPMTLVLLATGRDEKGNYVEKAYEKLSNPTGITKSYTIPKGVSTVKMKASFLGYECDVTWDVESGGTTQKTTTSTTTNTGFKWDDVASDNFCATCKKQASLYTFLSTDATGAQVVGGSGRIGCSQLSTKRFGQCCLNTPIYPGDGIYSLDHELIIGTEDNINMLRVEENSKILFVGKVDGRDRWRVLKGKLIGENLVKVERKQQIQMTNCVLDINGTIYVAVDDGKTSRVYLLDGSIDVTSTKTKKKYTMKSGQVVTVSNTGKMEAKKFDVAACAKKYNISESHIKDVPVTTTTTTTTTSTNKNTDNNKKKNSGSTTTSTDKRYQVKTGVIKYKYAVGNKQGTMVRTFDDYGHLERQTLKMDGASTRTLTIQRGSTQYSVDEKNKTVTKKAGNSKNFLTMTDAKNKKLNLTKKGTATIAGKTCTVYTGNNEEYYIWNGIVLKKKSKSKSGTVIYEATSIEQPSSVDENNFKVPSSYTMK